MFNVFGTNQYKEEEEQEIITLNNNTFFTKRNNKNSLNVKPKEKKKILLLLDTYDWSFFNIASRIKKQFTEYTIDILTTVDFYNNIKKTADTHFIHIIFTVFFIHHNFFQVMK